MTDIRFLILSATDCKIEAVDAYVDKDALKTLGFVYDGMGAWEWRAGRAASMDMIETLMGGGYTVRMGHGPEITAEIIAKARATLPRG